MTGFCILGALYFILGVLTKIKCRFLFITSTNFGRRLCFGAVCVHTFICISICIQTYKKVANRLWLNSKSMLINWGLLLIVVFICLWSHASIQSTISMTSKTVWHHKHIITTSIYFIFFSIGFNVPFNIFQVISGRCLLVTGMITTL